MGATQPPTLLRLATAGSVDDGKSTLVGRLLHDSKSVLADQLDAVERVSRDRGLAHADLALLTDGLRAEREQGITIDVAYRYFATADRSFILADCPGHVQYTRNTVTGASTADAVVLLVDARKGVLEQTRRHLAVAALLRVPHVVVAVNKIDLVDFDAAVYERVSADLAGVAARPGAARHRAVPVSALEGDNVVDRSARTTGMTARASSRCWKPFPLLRIRSPRRSGSRCSYPAAAGGGAGRGPPRVPRLRRADRLRCGPGRRRGGRAAQRAAHHRGRHRHRERRADRGLCADVGRAAAGRRHRHGPGRPDRRGGAGARADPGPRSPPSAGSRTCR